MLFEVVLYAARRGVWRRCLDGERTTAYFMWLINGHEVKHPIYHAGLEHMLNSQQIDQLFKRIHCSASRMDAYRHLNKHHR